MASGKQGSGAAVTGMKQKSREWTRITSGLCKDFHTIDSPSGHVNASLLSLGLSAVLFFVPGTRLLLGPRKVLVGLPRTFGLSAGPVHCTLASYFLALLH